MRGRRCLDCGFLHTASETPRCLICGSKWLVRSVRGTLDQVWAVHVQGFPLYNEYARTAWGDAVSDFVMEAAAARVLLRFDGWCHQRVERGVVVDERQVQHDVCFWG